MSEPAQPTSDATSQAAPVQPQSTPTPDAGAQPSQLRTQLDQQRQVQQHKEAQKKLDALIDARLQERLQAMIPQQQVDTPSESTRIEQLERQIAAFNAQTEQARQQQLREAERGRIAAQLQETKGFPGVLKVGDTAVESIYQMMEQQYQQTGAWPSESEVANTVEENLRNLYQQLHEVYSGLPAAPPPAPEVPTLSSSQAGVSTGQRGTEPITDPRQLSSQGYMDQLFRQVRNQR